MRKISKTILACEKHEAVNGAHVFPPQPKFKEFLFCHRAFRYLLVQISLHGSLPDLTFIFLLYFCPNRILLETGCKIFELKSKNNARNGNYFLTQRHTPKNNHVRGITNKYDPLIPGFFLILSITGASLLKGCEGKFSPQPIISMRTSHQPSFRFVRILLSHIFSDCRGQGSAYLPVFQGTLFNPGSDANGQISEYL